MPEEQTEPLPSCGDDKPESHAGEPVDDGWDEVVDMTTHPAGVTPAQVIEEVIRDGELDSGAEPDQPAS